MENTQEIGIGKPVKYKIGFADSEILSFKSEKNHVVVYLLTWNETVLEMKFMDCLCFLSFGATDISEICENSSSKLLQVALDQKRPLEQGYKLYQLLDLQDESSMEIVSKDLVITEAKDYPLSQKFENEPFWIN